MVPERPENRTLPWVLGLGAVALLSVGGGAWLTFQSNPGVINPPITASPIPVTNQFDLYWLNPDATALVKSTTPLTIDPQVATAEDTVRLGLEQLLQGPSNPSQATTIPSGTRLTGLEFRPDGIHINLSSDFKEGGGSTSMQGRLGQVIFTATSLDPQAKVWLAIDGQPLTLLGGEGAEVKQPMTRQDFTQSFSIPVD